MLCDLKMLIKYFICVLISIGWYQTYTSVAFSIFEFINETVQNAKKLAL